MVEAGILGHEIPIAEFSVADRDCQDYVFSGMGSRARRGRRARDLSSSAALLLL
jgi:hypothetical protein